MVDWQLKLNYLKTMIMLLFQEGFWSIVFILIGIICIISIIYYICMKILELYEVIVNQENINKVENELERFVFEKQEFEQELNTIKEKYDNLQIFVESNKIYIEKNRRGKINRNSYIKLKNLFKIK